MHEWKRLLSGIQGRGTVGKAIVFGVLQRNTIVFTLLAASLLGGQLKASAAGIGGTGEADSVGLPTVARVAAFLSADSTEQAVYTEEYNCTAFSKALVANARVAGLQALVVNVDFVNGEYHAFVEFETASGPIWIEPQADDQVARYQVGFPYGNLCMMATGWCWPDHVRAAYLLIDQANPAYFVEFYRVEPVQ